MFAEPPLEPAKADRKRWMSVLAKAAPQELRQAWEALAQAPEFTAIRAAESGLVLVRGRAGGAGAPFNLGEMTVTRAAVRLQGGETGLAYVAGRDRRHAELAAAVDAMMQSASLRAAAERTVVGPLARAQAERRETSARKAAATKVDFFTMVRTRSPG